MSGARKVRWLIRLVAVATLVIATSLPSRSAAPQMATRRYGPLSVASGQKVTLFVSNLTAETVRPKLQFLNEDGNADAQQQPSIAPGATVGLTPDASGKPAGYTLVASVRGPKDVLRGLASSLVLEDGNGATLEEWDSNSPLHFGADACFGGSPVHLGDGQRLKIIITNLGTGSRTFDVAALDADEEVIESGVLSNIGPANTRSMSFSASTTGDIRPVMTAPAGTKALVSVELFEETRTVAETTGFRACNGYRYE